jgi:hypothetical protein
MEDQSYFHQLSTLKDQIRLETGGDHILRIESTPKTPFVYIDGAKGIVVIFGRSISDNVRKFYDPILEFIDEKLRNNSIIHIYFRIYYCGSASGKYIQLLVRSLDKIFLQGQNMNIYWFQEEDNADMYTDGESYQIHTSIPFKIVELEDGELEDLDNFLSQL